MNDVNELLSIIKITIPNTYSVIGGSSILPYIKNKRDIDLITICNTDDALSQARTLRTKLGTELQFDKPLDWMIYPLYRCHPNPLVWYEYHFWEPCQYIVDIYNDDMITEIIERCMRVFNTDYQNPLYIRYTKKLYHIYTNLCMLKNGNYQLTDEEKERINRFHDCCGTDEDYQLLLQMFDEAKAKYLPNE